MTSQDVAHQQVVACPSPSDVSVVLMPCADLRDDRLVGAQGPVDHDRDLLGAVGRALDRRQLGRVARVADGDATQALDPFGEHVDELELLLGVLVEQQVQLVERRPATSQWCFLYSAVEDHRVGEDLVEERAAARSWPSPAGRSAGSQRAESLDAPAPLAPRMGSGEDAVGRAAVGQGGGLAIVRLALSRGLAHSRVIAGSRSRWPAVAGHARRIAVASATRGHRSSQGPSGERLEPVQRLGQVRRGRTRSGSGCRGGRTASPAAAGPLRPRRARPPSRRSGRRARSAAGTRSSRPAAGPR